MSRTPNEAVVSTLNIETKQPTAAVAANSTEIVEAGCSFSGDQIEAEPGSTNIVACPAGCEEDGVIYGTDIYTGHTYICIAAIHSGLITAQQGGQVGVIIEKGRPAYRGSTRNRVRSHDYGKFGSSYRLAPVK